MGGSQKSSSYVPGKRVRNRGHTEEVVIQQMGQLSARVRVSIYLVLLYFCETRKGEESQTNGMVNSDGVLISYYFQ